MIKIALDRFHGGRQKALVMSYDDGIEQDRRLVAIFNRYGIRATFHLNSGTLDRPGFVTSTEVAALYAGHEVSVHSVTHPHLAQIPSEKVMWELSEDRKFLERLVGYPVKGMSYPFGTYSERLKKMLPIAGIVYARGVEATHRFDLPEDYLLWRPTCHHNDQLQRWTDQFLDDTHRDKLALFNVWGHSYELKSEQDWDIIEQFCRKMGSRDDIWCATYRDIYLYMQAMQGLQFSVDCATVYNPSAISVWFSVEGNPYCVQSGEIVHL